MSEQTSLEFANALCEITINNPLTYSRKTKLHSDYRDSLTPGFRELCTEPNNPDDVKILHSIELSLQYMEFKRHNNKYLIKKIHYCG